jgi:hypothetical protein
MSFRDFRNFALVVIAAALCFGGSFVCTSHSHDDDGSQSGGFVVVNP